MFNILQEAGRLICPYRCLLCRKRLAERYICHSCRPPERSGICEYNCIVCFTSTNELDVSERCNLCALFPLPYSRVRYLWNYSDANVASFITSMKYAPSPALLRYACKHLALALPYYFGSCEWDALVPMPIARQHFRERGFDHCFQIAKTLKRCCSFVSTTPIISSALTHRGYKYAQASLPHGERIKNVRYSFKCASLVKELKVLLIDDVITTGATLHFAAQALLDAGAQTVDVLALAKAPVWQEMRAELYMRSTKANGCRFG
ncbi:MAG: ComF family protein [Deltaproteobacteria bacterium]|nr:ComF family protein [Deltaproteobacteria bacterium]